MPVVKLVTFHLKFPFSFHLEKKKKGAVEKGSAF